MWRSLWRLRQFAGKYSALLMFGIACFLGARILEAQVPLFLKEGIDRIDAGNLDVTWPVAGIFLAVLARFGVVSLARYTVRQVGLRVAFDIRQQLFSTLQQQGQRIL